MTFAIATRRNCWRPGCIPRSRRNGSATRRSRLQWISTHTSRRRCMRTRRPRSTRPTRRRGLAVTGRMGRNAHMKIIGILVAIACLAMSGAAQAACPTLPDAYQLQRDARARDMTPEQFEEMKIAGLLVRAGAGFKSAVEELACRGWRQSQIDEAVHRMAARRAISR